MSSSGVADLKGQQDVARQPTPLGVAGINVQHAVHDDRSGAVHGAAMARNAVDRGVLARGVELPKQLCPDIATAVLKTVFAATAPAIPSKIIMIPAK